MTQISCWWASIICWHIDASNFLTSSNFLAKHLVSSILILVCTFYYWNSHSASNALTSASQVSLSTIAALSFTATTLSFIASTDFIKKLRELSSWVTNYHQGNIEIRYLKEGWSTFLYLNDCFKGPRHIDFRVNLSMSASQRRDWICSLADLGSSVRFGANSLEELSPNILVFENLAYWPSFSLIKMLDSWSLMAALHITFKSFGSIGF